MRRVSIHTTRDIVKNSMYTALGADKCHSMRLRRTCGFAKLWITRSEERRNLICRMQIIDEENNASLMSFV